MEQFIKLLSVFSNSDSSERRTLYWKEFLDTSSDHDIAWAIGLMSGKKLKRCCSIKELVELSRDQCDLDKRIFNACMEYCTDKVEALSLVLPSIEKPGDLPLSIAMDKIRHLKEEKPRDRMTKIKALWTDLSGSERILVNKILTGTFHPPVKQIEFFGYLANYLDVSLPSICLTFHQIADHPYVELQRLKDSSDAAMDDIIHPELMPIREVEQIKSLKSPDQYFISPELDGLRVQLIKVDNQTHIWSWREGLLTTKFPEIENIHPILPDESNIEGILVAQDKTGLKPCQFVEKRIRRKKVTERIVAGNEISFCAIDLIKINGTMQTDKSFRERRSKLFQLLDKIDKPGFLQIIDDFQISSWEQVDLQWNNLKYMHSHALILKHCEQPYSNNYHWHKVKAPAKTALGILLYARRGEGARSNQIVELTLGAKSGEQLIPFTKIVPDFEDEDFLAIKKYIRENTIERFGPVYSVKAALIFEIQYDAVQISTRHKCGLILVNPKLMKWVKNYSSTDVTMLEEIRKEIPD